jgi:adenylate cyclase
MQPRLNACKAAPNMMKALGAVDAAMPSRNITAWLRGAGARSLDDAALIASLGRHLYDAGLGLDRVTFHVGTLHPDVFARILAWTPGEPVEVFEQDHPATVAASFPESPFRHAASLKKKLVVRGVDPQFLGRAAGHSLRGRGVGELVSAPVSDRDGRTVVVSFYAARPRIFGATDHLIIDSVLVSLRTARASATWMRGNTRDPSDLNHAASCGDRRYDIDHEDCAVNRRRVTEA